MKAAVIVYHKNVKQYPEPWIDQFRRSIDQQTFKEFDIYEMDYGGDQNRIFSTSIFTSLQLNNHAEAQNYLIDMCFSLDYDYVFNTNVDDWYEPTRIQSQLKYLEKGFDIVSSNFQLINDQGELYHEHQFDTLDIRKELDRDHNIICHPVVAYSKHFWSYNRYWPFEIPFEDMNLWKRTAGSFRFIIIPEVLCFHRVHSSSIGNTK